MKLACFLKRNTFCIMALRMPQTDEKQNGLFATTKEKMLLFFCKNKKIQALYPVHFAKLRLIIHV